MVKQGIRAGICAAVAAGIVAAQSTPVWADQTRDAQWALTALDIEAAHQATRGAGVTIGIVDTGVDATHPDLDGSVLPGMSTWDDKGDGLADTVGHGTSMASLLVGHGHGGGGDGILGIAPEAKVLPVSAYPTDYDPSKSDTEVGRQIEDGFVKGIRWLADQNVDVILVAAGGSPSDEELAAVEYATERKNVPIVAAAGNTSDSVGGDVVVQAPAMYDQVFGVSGTTRDGDFWTGSVEGGQVSLAAPAQDIISAKAGGGYTTDSGTSSASAMVAGTVALMKAQWPDMAWEDIEWRITETADDAGDPGSDKQFGYGIVNPAEALTAHVDPPQGVSDEQINPEPQPQEPDTDAGSQSEAAAKDSTGSGIGPWLIIAAGAVILVAFTIALVIWRRNKTRKASRHPSDPTTVGASTEPRSGQFPPN